jgi:hypothetical protein
MTQARRPVNPEPPTPQYFSLKPLGEWARRDVATAITVAGFAIFGVARFSVLLFYNRLGLRPEDVGIGYAQTLLPAVYILVVTFVWDLIVLTIVFSVGIQIDLRRKENARAQKRALENRALTTDIRFQMVFSIMLSIILIWIPGVSYYRAGEILDGRVPTTSETLVPGLLFTQLFVLDRGGAIADLRWISAPPSSTVLSGDICTIYLGSADGFSVVYVRPVGRVIRIPSSSITISIRNNSGSPHKCPSKPP